MSRRAPGLRYGPHPEATSPAPPASPFPRRATGAVIPNRGPASVRRTERSSKVIWETVKRVGKRVGVRTTAHSFRRAFAVAFLTSHPGAIESLQALMNHSRIDKRRFT